MIVTEEKATTDAVVADPREVYEGRRNRFGAERDRLEAFSRRISNIRLGVFALAALGVIFFLSGGTALYLAGSGLLMLVFLVLVVYHDRVIGQARRYGELYAISDEAQKRLDRRWNELPTRPFTEPAPDHAYANDIDVFGRASLFQLLDVTSTSSGSMTLQRWLLEPAAPNVARARQEAVAELAPLIEMRDEVTLRGRLIGAKKPDPSAFLEWAEADSWLLRQPLFIWAGRVLPVLMWAAIIASLTGLSSLPLWLPMVAINLVFLALVGSRVEATLAWVYSSARAFGFYTELLQIVSEAKFKSPALVDLQEQLRVGGTDAYRQMGRLSRLAGLTIPLFSPLSLPIQLVSFWNLNTLYFLERWQIAAGPQARSWLRALGEFEALSSLAGLAHSQPQWEFPTIEQAAAKSGAKLAATRLGHPLLSDSSRVDNDVTVGPTSTFLLVTGSNMSGKSTLLRSLGTNIVLAQTGSVVCAANLQMPPLALYTSIRIQDSLEQGISLFMAELLRLKQVVEAADRVEQEGQRTMFYLLDEILHGTNTAERQIAARRIIAHLLAHGAIGAISTHDLQLADTPELLKARQDVHFVEQFRNGDDGPAMTFDYQLRPGLATSTNALKLMQIVGLDLD